MSDDAPFEAFVDLIPDGCVPTMGLMLLAYIDADGNEKSRWALHGDNHLGTVFGVMEYAKFQMVKQYGEESE